MPETRKRRVILRQALSWLGWLSGASVGADVAAGGSGAPVDGVCPPKTCPAPGAPPLDKSVITRAVTVAEGRFAPGHLGELAQQVPFEMIDAVLEETCRVQRRVRALPARVVVCLLLAGCLFAELGYSQVWQRMAAGLGCLPAAAPAASALTQARRRLGPGPLRELFFLLRGPSPHAARWKGLLV